MTRDDLTTALRAYAVGDDDVAAARDLLVAFEASGGTEREAFDVCMALYDEAADDRAADRFADVCDVVLGWGAPEMRVWRTEYPAG